jgi:SAM-dependent methyltransferase
MSRLTPAPTGREILDDLNADPVAVTRSLGNIARANKWFGGLAAVRFGLRRLLSGIQGPVTLLDVGTGTGDIPLMAARWAADRGIRLKPLGIERHPVAARVAFRNGLPMVMACGGALPIRTGSVDVVVVSQVAHHLDSGSCVTLFRECNRVGRLGTVVADLRRSRAAAAGFWIGSRLLRFDPVTCADGITSLRRGFTIGEFRELLRQAGIEGVVEYRPGARLIATWKSVS